MLPKELVPHKETQALQKPANEKKKFHERSNIEKSKFSRLSNILRGQKPLQTHFTLPSTLPPQKKREYPTQTTKLIYKLHGVQYHYLTIDSFKSFWTSTGVTTPWFITKLGKCFATSLVLCRKENNPKIIALSYVAKEETRDFMCPMALWGRIMTSDVIFWRLYPMYNTSCI